MSSDLLIPVITGSYFPFRFTTANVGNGGEVKWTFLVENSTLMLTDIDISSSDSTLACVVQISDLSGHVFFSDNVSIGSIAESFYFSWRGLRFLRVGEGITVQNIAVLAGPSMDVNMSGFIIPTDLFESEVDP